MRNTGTPSAQNVELPLSYLAPNSSESDILNQREADSSSKKVLQRKPASLTVPNAPKNASKQTHARIVSPRYMTNTPLKIVPMAESITDKAQLKSFTREDLKTERKEVANDKSAEKPGKSIKYDSDSADYYKYWKKKAGEYQQLNFSLHRLNSSLQEDNQVLKHKLEKMEKRLLKMMEPQPAVATYDQSKNYEKLENYYKVKVEQMSKKIQEQQLLIAKQAKKIKELSNYISQNYQLKNLLDNMEEKISEMRSNGSRDSRADSMEKMSDKGIIFKPKNMTLGVDYLESNNLSNKAIYGIKKPKRSENFSSMEHKSSWKYDS